MIIKLNLTKIIYKWHQISIGIKEKMWMYVNKMTGDILLQETFPHCFCTKDNPRYLIQR